MTFEEYQAASRRTAIYPDAGNNFIYPTLGLAGETGEVVEKVKKLVRDNAAPTVASVTQEKKSEIAKELGDVLWYLAQLSTEFGLKLEDVAQGNIEKLTARQNQGTLHGSGDNR
ncbi:MAG: nucleoside triphosphate pyrophosphohydrolase family protein [Patescibacteria group bacterium]